MIAFSDHRIHWFYSKIKREVLVLKFKVFRKVDRLLVKDLIQYFKVFILDINK